MSLLQEERNIIVQNKYADNFDFAEIEEFIKGASKNLFISHHIKNKKKMLVQPRGGFPTYKKTGFDGLNITMLILMHNTKRAPYPDSNQWRKIIPYIKQEIYNGMLDPNYFKDIETSIERINN